MECDLIAVRIVSRSGSNEGFSVSVVKVPEGNLKPFGKEGQPEF